MLKHGRYVHSPVSRKLNYHDERYVEPSLSSVYRWDSMTESLKTRRNRKEMSLPPQRWQVLSRIAFPHFVTKGDGDSKQSTKSNPATMSHAVFIANQSARWHRSHHGKTCSVPVMQPVPTLFFVYFASLHELFFGFCRFSTTHCDSGKYLVAHDCDATNPRSVPVEAAVSFFGGFVCNSDLLGTKKKEVREKKRRAKLQLAVH